MPNQHDKANIRWTELYIHVPAYEVPCRAQIIGVGAALGEGDRESGGSQLVYTQTAVIHKVGCTPYLVLVAKVDVHFCKGGAEVEGIGLHTDSDGHVIGCYCLGAPVVDVKIHWGDGAEAAGARSDMIGAGVGIGVISGGGDIGVGVVWIRRGRRREQKKTVVKRQSF